MSCDSDVDVKSKGGVEFALSVCWGRCLDRAARRFINRFYVEKSLKLYVMRSFKSIFDGCIYSISDRKGETCCFADYGGLTSQHRRVPVLGLGL